MENDHGNELKSGTEADEEQRGIGSCRHFSMVSWGRSKLISTAVCTFLFTGYLFMEFGMKRNDVIGTQPAVLNVTVEHAQRHVVNDAIVNDAHSVNTKLIITNEQEQAGKDLEQPEQSAKPPESVLPEERPPEQEPVQLQEKPAEPVQPEKPPQNEAADVQRTDPKPNQENPEANLKPGPTKLPSQNDVVVRKFDPDKPKFILLLAQQRVGSTFIGGIFDRNPKAIYIYEPLEGVYTHLYGTKKGWAVPLDIHFHWNNTFRALPAFEMHAVATLIEQIFTCDYHHMLTEFIVHEFWSTFKQTQAHTYASCLRGIQVSVSKCQAKLASVCEVRIGQNLKKEKYCKEQLELVFSGKPAAEPFKQYKSCIDTERSQVFQKCISIVDKTCKSKALSVIKTVRMDLETIVPLMDKYPNMRVIHLIRDPRSVVLSRIKSGWSTHGATPLKQSRDSLKAQHPKTSSDLVHHVNGSIDYDEFSLDDEMKFAPIPPNGVAKEAQMYCSLTRKDIVTRRYLEQKYPGSTYQMIYEHMVYHPLHELERIYEFIDEPVPSSITSWVKTLNSGKKTSQSIATKWQNEMSVESAKQIDKFCQNLYDTIEFTWPDPVRP